MERFYHMRVRPSGAMWLDPLNNGGATVRVISAENDPNYVGIAVAWCNPKDVFCKKLGRNIAATAPLERVHIRKIPAFFNDVYKQVHRRMGIRPLSTMDRPNFESRIREWLPKE